MPAQEHSGLTWMKWHTGLRSLSCSLLCSQHSLLCKPSLLCLRFLQNFLSISLHELHTKYLLCEMPAGFTSECSHLSRSSHTFLQPLTLLLAALLLSVPSWHFSSSFDCCCAPWAVIIAVCWKDWLVAQLYAFGRGDFLSWGHPSSLFPNSPWRENTPISCLPWLKQEPGIYSY